MAVWSKSFVKDLHFDRRMDAEYYQPKYIAYEKAVKKVPNVVKLVTLGDFVIGPFGSAFDTKKYENNSEYRYIRGRDVKPFILLDDDNRYIPEDDYRRLARYQVRDDDIFISVVGTLGNAAICPTHNIKAIFSCKSTVFRQRKIDAYYLLSYLNTKYGFNLLIRRQRGAVQGGLNVPDLSALLVPRFELAVEKSIGSFVKKSFKLRNSAKESYTAAERMLAEALKLDDLKLERPLSYTAKFSDVLREGRTDADYFQVPYVQMHKHLDKLNTVRLSALVDFTKGVEVGSGAYVDEGKLFMRVSNLTVRGLKFNTSDRFVSESTYDLLKSACQPRVGELLLTKDGSPGVCWAVDREIEALMSGAIVRMSLKNREVPAEYLALVVNSKLCQMQVEQNASGALILHWKLPLIKRLRVPLCDQETMKAIAKLVKDSKKQQAKSEALLAEAKATVERLIEAAADRT